MKTDRKRIVLINRGNVTRNLFKKRLRRPFHKVGNRVLTSLNIDPPFSLEWGEILPPSEKPQEVGFSSYLRSFFKEKKVKNLKKPITKMLDSDAVRLLSAFYQLQENTDLSFDPRFLDRIARDIKQLSHDALLAVKIPSLKKRARLILHVLQTPVGAPFVSPVTFIEAVDHFSEQEPLHSDLFKMIRSALRNKSLRIEILKAALNL